MVQHQALPAPAWTSSIEEQYTAFAEWEERTAGGADWTASILCGGKEVLWRGRNEHLCPQSQATAGRIRPQGQVVLMSYHKPRQTNVTVCWLIHVLYYVSSKCSFMWWFTRLSVEIATFSRNCMFGKQMLLLFENLQFIKGDRLITQHSTTCHYVWRVLCGAPL